MLKHDARIGRVLGYIDAHYDALVKLKKLAELANLSEYHFSRLFKAHTGLSPMSYLNRRRLEKAIAFLGEGVMSIAETAYACGFKSLSNFNSLFKERYGCSPREYRTRKSRIQEKNSNIKGDEGIYPAHNLGTSFLRRIWEMNISIKDLPSYRIAYFRHTGNYLNTGSNWKKILDWVSKADLYKNHPIFIGISRDDPAITEEDACRHDACVTLPVNFSEERHPDVNFETLPGGKYAIYHFYDTVDKLAIAFQSLYGQWLPQSAYESDERPCLEINLNNPAEDPERKSRCDICIPIRDRS